MPPTRQEERLGHRVQGTRGEGLRGEELPYKSNRKWDFPPSEVSEQVALTDKYKDFVRVYNAHAYLLTQYLKDELEKIWNKLIEIEPPLP